MRHWSLRDEAPQATITNKSGIGYKRVAWGERPALLPSDRSGPPDLARVWRLLNFRRRAKISVLRMGVSRDSRAADEWVKRMRAGAGTPRLDEALRPVLERLGQMLHRDSIRSRKVADGPRQLECAMKRPRRQVHLIHSRFQ